MTEVSAVFLYVAFAAVACLMMAATALRWLRLRREKKTTLSFWKYLSTITGPNADPPPFQATAMHETLPRYRGTDEEPVFAIVCRSQDGLVREAAVPAPPMYSR
ncbi:hypothetical protein BJ741DRAFT_586146 [Chytriomyces cf. hyalinus JEL632]|nr:hypothetical protein BJ741DRAFT_586146 [Chytriomyces cf. hyalinus JEL632]